MKKTILVCCIALMTLAGLYANGTLTGVTDKTKLNGTLVIPARVKEIGYSAFDGCRGITEVDLSGCTSLTTIGERAFFDCTGIRAVRLPASLTTIGGSAFEGCIGLTEVKLPESLTEIDWCAFKCCSSLKEVSLPAGLTYLGDGGFAHCTGLTHVSLPASLIDIGAGAFADCTHLAEIHVPARVSTIGNQAFWNILPKARFTVQTDEVKELLKNSGSGIKDEQITVKGIN